MRSNFPETYNYLKAKKARHPQEDAIEDFTQWTLLGTAADAAALGQIPKPGASLRQDAPKAPVAPAPKKEETEEEYVSRRCEEYMHKTLSSRCALVHAHTHTQAPAAAHISHGTRVMHASGAAVQISHELTRLLSLSPLAVAAWVASSSRLAAAVTAACRTRCCSCA